MPFLDERIYIDPIDFIDECSEKDINKIITELQDRGLISNINPMTKVMDNRWLDKVYKLYTNKNQLSVEEEATIEKIANKLM